jgi:hypothetical protein
VTFSACSEHAASGAGDLSAKLTNIDENSAVAAATMKNRRMSPILPI